MAYSNTIHEVMFCDECNVYSQHVQFHLHAKASILDEDEVVPQPRTLAEAIELGRSLQLDEDKVLFSRYRGRLNSSRQKYDDEVLLRTRYQEEVEHLRAEAAEVNDRLMAVQMAYDDLVMDYAKVHRGPSQEPADEPRVSFTSSNGNFGGGWDDDEADFDVQQQLQLMEKWDEEDTEWLESRDDFSDDHASYSFPPSSPSSFDSSPASESGYTSIRKQMSARHAPLADLTIPEIAELIESADQGDILAIAQVESLIHVATRISDKSRTPEQVYVLLSWSTLAAPNSRPSSPSPTPSFPAPSITPGRDSSTTELTIAGIDTLMADAHQFNTTALEEVRSLIRQAERTPKKRRTAIQLYLLLKWRSPRAAPSPPIRIIQSDRAVPSSHMGVPPVPHMFVDASGSGIGLIFDDMWLAWKFPSRHPLLPLGPDGKLIMSWAELIAVELGVRTLLAANYRNVSVVIRSDNEGVVHAFKQRKWIPKWGLDDILQRVLGLCHEGGIQLQVKWVWTKVNPADKPSRGVYPPAAMMLSYRPQVPEDLVEVIREVGAH